MTPAQWMKDHPWIGGLSALLVALLLLAAGLALHLRGVRERAARQRSNLAKMEQLAAEMRVLRARAEGMRPVALPAGMRFGPAEVDRIAKDAHINIAPRISAVGVTSGRREGRMQEQLINLTISGVTRQELAMFLHAVEQINPAVRTRELRVANNAKQPALVDAKVQISAHETIGPTQ